MEPVEFAVGAFSGLVTNKAVRAAEAAGEEPSAEDVRATKDSATHYVTDRPLPKGFVPQPGIEYVQPQWLFDCVNNRMLLPVERHARRREKCRTPTIIFTEYFL